MIGGGILAAWTPFWTGLSALSTLDFMRTSTGQPSIGTMFLPVGVSSGFTVLGIFVMVFAFIRLAGQNAHFPQSERPFRNTQESSSRVIATALVSMGSKTLLSPPANAIPHEPTLAFGYLIVLPDGREVVSCEQGDLRAAYKANTIDQCNRLLCGRWVKLFGDINQNFGKGHIILEYSESPMLSLRFSEHWIEQLSCLTRGSTVTFRGRIFEVDQISINIRDCEMV